VKYRITKIIMKYLIVFLCLVFIAHGALQVVSPS